MPDTTSRIRELNDQLRCQHRGSTIMVTAGVQSMGADFIAAVDVALTKVTFDSDNDPYGEHDFRRRRGQGKARLFQDQLLAEYVAILSPAQQEHLRGMVRNAYVDGEPDGPRSFAAFAWGVAGIASA